MAPRSPEQADDQRKQSSLPCHSNRLTPRRSNRWKRHLPLCDCFPSTWWGSLRPALDCRSTASMYRPIQSNPIAHRAHPMAAIERIEEPKRSFAYLPQKTACVSRVAPLTRLDDQDWYRKLPSRPLRRDRQRTNPAGNLRSACRNSGRQTRYQRCRRLRPCSDNSHR